MNIRFQIFNLFNLFYQVMRYFNILFILRYRVCLLVLIIYQIYLSSIQFNQVYMLYVELLSYIRYLKFVKVWKFTQLKLDFDSCSTPCVACCIAPFVSFDECCSLTLRGWIHQSIEIRFTSTHFDHFIRNIFSIPLCSRNIKFELSMFSPQICLGSTLFYYLRVNITKVHFRELWLHIYLVILFFFVQSQMPLYLPVFGNLS